MPLDVGTRLGPYEIASPLGAGGMGEVYEARDTRLDRRVAVKILPEHLSDSPERKERFEREARAISQLNHPHICTLHDVGAQDGVHFLVMELIEGETLAKRLQKGALSLDRALDLAIQIASGLDAAHRAGIMHRDLKPGNIMITKSGVKILDFGLAKVIEASSSDDSDSPTIQRGLTDERAVLGTLQYMSPEQLDARDADARSDIFAFGAILYEMVTGQRAFSGKGQASLVAAIMEHDPPPVSSLKPLSPPLLDAIVATCLAKDPDERWQSAGDLEKQLSWVKAVGETASFRSASRGVTAWVVAAVALIAAFVLGYQRLQPTPPAPVQRLSVAPPEGVSFARVQPPAISPDGRHLAFVGRDADGSTQLWVRAIDSLEARPVPGAEDAASPFWSPDGRFLAFFAQGRLKRVDLSGGPLQILREAAAGRGGAWNRDDRILVVNILGTVQAMPAAGGETIDVTALKTELGERSHRWPNFLPDGDHFLYFNLTGQNHRGVYVGSSSSMETKLVLPINTNAIYALGHLLYVDRGVLTARAFDLDRLELTGEPVALADGVAYDPVVRRGLFSASETGVIAYSRGAGHELRRLTWYDRSGQEIGHVGETADWREPWLFRDARSLLVARLDPDSGTYDIWHADLDRGVSSRLTADPSQDWFPIAAPDEPRFLFSSSRSGAYDIYSKSTSGTGPAELLSHSDTNKFLTDWSPRADAIVFQELGLQGQWDIWTLPDRKDAEPVPFLASEFSEQQGRLSPDGRWLAYISNETGRFEVYVQPFPATGARWQVSSEGGFQPRWRGDGRELFYLRRDEKLMAVSVRSGETFTTGVPQVLFDTRLDILGNVEYTRHYDVSPDGQRFLLSSLVDEDGAAPITILTNWPSLLERD